MAEETKDKVVSEQDGKGNENKAETANAEAPKKEEAKTDEKKESGFSKWWKGTKAKVDSDMSLFTHSPADFGEDFVVPGGKEVSEESLKDTHDKGDGNRPPNNIHAVLLFCPGFEILRV